MAVDGEITATIEEYLDGLYEGSLAKMKNVFHPCAHLYSATGDDFVDIPLPDYLDIVAGRPSPQSKSEPRFGRIVAVDKVGPNTAMAKVETAVAPKNFTDYLTLLKVDNRWQIVSKVFHFTLDE